MWQLVSAGLDLPQLPHRGSTHAPAMYIPGLPPSSTSESEKKCAGEYTKMYFNVFLASFRSPCIHKAGMGRDGWYVGQGAERRYMDQCESSSERNVRSFHYERSTERLRDCRGEEGDDTHTWLKIDGTTHQLRFEGVVFPPFS